jgi:hypothetical protein
VCALGFLAIGCGGEGAGPLGDAKDVKVWATTASALGVYANIHGPVAYANGKTTFPDPNCPVTSDDGTTVTISGGCTEQGGYEWVGSVSAVRSDNGDLSLEFMDYATYSDPEARNTQSGRAEVRRLEDELHEFDVDITLEGGVTTRIDYQGRVEGTYDAPTVWSGSGSVSREGPANPRGSITASTLAELVDNDVCAGQPVSGETSLKAGGQTAVIYYDGASDCDDTATVRWSLDGEDRGRLPGIVCSVGHAGGHGAPRAPLWVALGLLLGFAARRRPEAGARSRRS